MYKRTDTVAPLAPSMGHATEKGQSAPPDFAEFFG